MARGDYTDEIRAKFPNMPGTYRGKQIQIASRPIGNPPAQISGTIGKIAPAQSLWDFVDENIETLRTQWSKDDPDDPDTEVVPPELANDPYYKDLAPAAKARRATRSRTPTRRAGSSPSPPRTRCSAQR